MIGKIELWQIIKDHEKETGQEFSPLMKNHIIEIVQKVERLSNPINNDLHIPAVMPSVCEHKNTRYSMYNTKRLWCEDCMSFVPHTEA